MEDFTVWGLEWLQLHASPGTGLHVKNTICYVNSLKASWRTDQILSGLVPLAALFCEFILRWEVVQALLPEDASVTVGIKSPDDVFLQSILDPRFSGSHLFLAFPRMMCTIQSLGMSWKIYEREGLLDCWCHQARHCHSRFLVRATRAQGWEAWTPLCSRP